ncbi:MAG: hypothetical protein QF918_11975, partial [Pirellulaceae bacterium]|nr:hypothetical protein [Pirellulaceae bacterium]
RCDNLLQASQTIQYPAGFIRQRRKTSLSHLRSLLASVTRFTPRKLTGGCDLGFIERYWG